MTMQCIKNEQNQSKMEREEKKIHRKPWINSVKWQNEQVWCPLFFVQGKTIHGQYLPQRSALPEGLWARGTAEKVVAVWTLGLLAEVTHWTLFRKTEEQRNKCRAQGLLGIWGSAYWIYCFSGQGEPLAGACKLVFLTWQLSKMLYLGATNLFQP